MEADNPPMGSSTCQKLQGTLAAVVQHTTVADRDGKFSLVAPGSH